MLAQHKQDLVIEAAKATPPVGAATAIAAGLNVNTLVLWATLIYIVLQIMFLVYKWKRLHFDHRKSPPDTEE
jgi:hypothetical protein